MLYALVGTTTILVLRGMSRRFRDAEDFTDLDTPYGPSQPRCRPARGGRSVSTAVAVVLLLAVVAYAVFGGADFGAASGT